MSMLSYHKFSGDDRIYVIQSACTTLWYSKSLWDIYSTQILPAQYDYAFNQLNHIELNHLKTEVASGDKRIIKNLDEVEWMEFRVPRRHVHKDWYKFFKEKVNSSSIGKYLYSDRGQLRFRFNQDTPMVRVIFVLSILRYADEFAEDLQEFYTDFPKYHQLPADRWLALFSAAYIRMNCHGVFQPCASLKGLYNYLDEYFELVLDPDLPSMADYREQKKDAHYFDHMFFPQKRAVDRWGQSALGLYGGPNGGVDGWHRYFTQKEAA